MYLKKIFVLLIFFIGKSTLVTSQTFPTDSVVWHYQLSDFSGPTPITIPVDYISLNDTTINNTLYSRVYSSLDGIEYLYYVDSGRVWGRLLLPSVFQCTDTNDILIYDFTLNMGDSIYIPNCYGDSFLCIVTITDSVMTNLGFRKEIKFANQSAFTCISSDTLTWIEGVGSFNDLFYNLNFFRPGLVCEAYYYFGALESNGQFVYLITDVGENKKVSNLFIDFNKVIHSDSYIDNITIYDISGKELFHQKLKNKEVDLSTNALPPGVFIIKLDIEENTYMLKLLEY